MEDLIVFFGANPANDQPVMTKYLHEAKKQGTKIALVNPYDEPAMKRYWVPSSVDSALFGTDITDYWFPVSQGSDIAFLYGVLKILFENDWFYKLTESGNTYQSHLNESVLYENDTIVQSALLGTNVFIITKSKDDSSYMLR